MSGESNANKPPAPSRPYFFYNSVIEALPSREEARLLRSSNGEVVATSVALSSQPSEPVSALPSTEESPSSAPTSVSPVQLAEVEDRNEHLRNVIDAMAAEAATSFFEAKKNVSDGRPKRKKRKYELSDKSRRKSEKDSSRNSKKKSAKSSSSSSSRSTKSKSIHPDEKSRKRDKNRIDEDESGNDEEEEDEERSVDLNSSISDSSSIGSRSSSSSSSRSASSSVSSSSSSSENSDSDSSSSSSSSSEALRRKVKASDHSKSSSRGGKRGVASTSKQSRVKKGKISSGKKGKGRGAPSPQQEESDSDLDLKILGEKGLIVHGSLLSQIAQELVADVGDQYASDIRVVSEFSRRASLHPHVFLDAVQQILPPAEYLEYGGSKDLDSDDQEDNDPTDISFQKEGYRTYVIYPISSSTMQKAHEAGAGVVKYPLAIPREKLLEKLTTKDVMCYVSFGDLLIDSLMWYSGVPPSVFSDAIYDYSRFRFIFHIEDAAFYNWDASIDLLADLPESSVAIKGNRPQQQNIAFSRDDVHVFVSERDYVVIFFEFHIKQFQPISRRCRFYVCLYSSDLCVRLDAETPEFALGARWPYDDRGSALREEQGPSFLRMCLSSESSIEQGIQERYLMKFPPARVFGAFLNDV